jgi:hypothetical protein
MEANLNEILTEVETQIEECETTYARLQNTISILIENEYYKEAEWASDQLGNMPETLSEYRDTIEDIKAGLNISYQTCRF